MENSKRFYMFTYLEFQEEEREIGAEEILDDIIVLCF